MGAFIHVHSSLLPLQALSRIIVLATTAITYSILKLMGDWSGVSLQIPKIACRPGSR
jgi:hypothetical protein